MNSEVGVQTGSIRRNAPRSIYDPRQAAAHRAPGGLDPIAAGALGSLLTTWVTFAPCFLWIFLGAPFVEALRGAKALNAALGAITAAVVGVILNLAIWFGIHVLFRETRAVATAGVELDWPVLTSVNLVSLGLTVVAAIAIVRFKAGVIPVLTTCALLGAGLHLAGMVG